MNIDLKAIRAAAEAATPGPWEAAGPSFGAPLPKYLNCVVWVTEDDEFDDVCTAPLGSDGGNSADMIFIATANPATILELLDKLEAAEKDAARIRNAALEEAAVKCEEIDFSYSACEQFVSGEAAFECGKQIRSMKK